MNVRIKMIRKSQNLTQEAFGERIGIARNTIDNYEKGNRCPSNITITLMCKEFGVDENWLRYGIGEMFLSKDKDWKNSFQKEAELEAKRIMDMLNADETLKDVHAPDELFDKLMEQIREYEQEILNGAEPKDAAIICFEEAKKRISRNKE